MTEITKSKIAELRRLCEAATPGDWFVDLEANEDGSFTFHLMAEPYHWLFSLDDDNDEVEDYVIARTNAAFIAEAKKWLPLLLDAIEARMPTREEQ